VCGDERRAVEELMCLHVAEWVKGYYVFTAKNQKMEVERESRDMNGKECLV
jgi:hypothetical protein